ncbi:Cha4p [Sugiyamaella lignohabitans]|uniref:Cha4p n=1 Tax=Sugiyamaella lignohabitans TaxID=796027 RepID=A0A167F9G0_9ASCO|nr:Cha4p [Sugiyamaella lignohabitans]ANB14993.1 Cha4p [Sugiyamaella lignohabitans]
MSFIKSPPHDDSLVPNNNHRYPGPDTVGSSISGVNGGGSGINLNNGDGVMGNNSMGLGNGSGQGELGSGQGNANGGGGFSAINFGTGNFKPIPAGSISVPPSSMSPPGPTGGPTGGPKNFSFVANPVNPTNNSSKDKKKLVVACAGCRKKKIKCSGHRPACTNCLRINVECEYPIVRNRGSRYGYTKMLSRRLDALRVYCSEDLSEGSSPVSQISQSSNTSNSGGAPIGSSLNRALPITDEQQLMRQISSKSDQEAHHLHHLAEINLQKSSLSSQQGISGLSDLMTTTTAEDKRAANIITGLKSGPPTRKGSPEIDSLLPPSDIVIHLAEVYFKYIHNQTYSFLHKPTFMIRLRRGDVNRGLVLALCGLAARFSRHPKITKSGQNAHKAGEVFAERARQVLSREFDSPSVEAVQAMICLTQHDFFKHKGGKAMIYISMAMPMALNLGLNKELPDDSPATWLERECRRRTFWSLVVLDRLGHATSTYPIQLDEISDILLPCPYHNFENNIPTLTTTFANRDLSIPSHRDLDVFSYHMEATLIWNKINRYVSSKNNESTPPWKSDSKFAALEQEYLHLKNDVVPSKFKYSKGTLNELSALNRAGTYLHLHTELLAAQFLLYRTVYPYDPSRYSFPDKPPKEFIEKAVCNVQDAANSMAAIVSDILQLEDTTVAPFISFCVFTVSSVHVALSFSPDAVVAGRAKQNLALTLRLLVILREYWYIVGVWCVMLKDRYTKKLAVSKEGAARRQLQGGVSSDRIEFSETDGAHGDDDDEDGDKTTPTSLSRPSTPPAYLPEDLIKHGTSSNIGSTATTRPGSPFSTKPGLGSFHEFPGDQLPAKRIKVDMSTSNSHEQYTDHQPDADIHLGERQQLPSQDIPFSISGQPSSGAPSEMGTADILHDDGAEWLNALDSRNFFDFGSLYNFDSTIARPLPEVPAMQFNADKEQSILEHILENVMDKVPDDLY